MQHERYVRRIAESDPAHTIRRFPHDRLFERRRTTKSTSRWSAANVVPPTPAADSRPPLVRVHSHCLTGDVFASTACDCHATIERSLSAIAREDRGVFVYLHQTGRGFRIDSRTEEGAALPKILYHQREPCGPAGSWRAARRPARKWHRRANSDRSGLAAHPRPDESSRAASSRSKDTAWRSPTRSRLAFHARGSARKNPRIL